MKEGIHPQLNPVVFVDVSSGKEFITRSVMKAEKKKEIDGVEHSVIVCDVTADTHPAFTGEKRFVDTAGRVEKFEQKFSRQRRRG